MDCNKIESRLVLNRIRSLDHSDNPKTRQVYPHMFNVDKIYKFKILILNQMTFYLKTDLNRNTNNSSKSTGSPGTKYINSSHNKIWLVSCFVQKLYKTKQIKYLLSEITN